MKSGKIALLGAFTIALNLAAVTPAIEAQEENDKNIVTTAVAAGDFNVLVAALEAAGLDSALAGDGPFTVFAPTDAAFQKLPQGTLEALLEDSPRLEGILTYHVVPGRKMAADVIHAGHLDTLNGAALDIHSTDGGVEIAGARIVQTDIDAGNGVIHVIDAVMLPPTE